jgi:hypothetical protein
VATPAWAYILEAAADHGLLRLTKSGDYILTPTGRKAIDDGLVLNVSVPGHLFN